jgi:ABC-2 type transport system permease protein
MPREVATVHIVLRHELAVHLRGALAWALPLAGILVLTCALQPSLAAGPLAAKIDSLPEAMRHAFGLEVVDFHRPAAYLATNFMHVTLVLAAFAAVLGATIVAKEETLRTAELLYAQPVARWPILAGKAIAALTYVLALPLALALVAMATLGAIADRPLEPDLIAALFGGVACTCVCFAGAGMLVAATVRDARSATGAALGVVFGSFSLGVISVLSPSAAWLRWLSPFKLVEGPTLVAAGGLPPSHALGLVALGIGFAVLSCVRYSARDLHT